ncbi:helix-turn-helix domain-containing protein [Paenibacillus sp. MBLB4367]|uniref:helix-turn-helix domain-containing protein n=1 Tax=Paenibacillus sp. MBLB4367 TaxID=3384767 RepID=UPI0039083383
MIRKLRGMLRLGVFDNAKSGFYRKSFAIVLLITSLPTALLAFATYYVGTRQIEQEVNRTHQVRLQNTADKLNNQLAQLEKTVTMWTFDPMLKARLGSMTVETFEKSYELRNDLAQSLLVMGSSSPLLREVRLYIPGSELYISPLNSRVIVPLETRDEIVYYASLMQNEKNRYWAYVSGYLSLVQKLPERSPYGYLLARFDEAAINALIQTDNELKGTAFLLKDNGEWLDPAIGAEPDKHRFDFALKQKLSEEKDKSGSFFMDWQGEKYAASYGTIQATGWTYMSATPVSKLTQPVITMSRALIVIGCLGVAVAIFLSWFASRKLYQPIVRLVKLFRAEKADTAEIVAKDELEFIERQWQFLSSQSKHLHERLEQHLDSLRELFLFQLLHDHLSHLTEDDLRKRMEQYGWEVEGQTYALLVVRLLGFSKLQDRFVDGDEQLVTFAAANVIGELADSLFAQAEVINEQDLSVSVLVLLPDGQPDGEAKKQLQSFSEHMIHTLSAVLKMNVMIGLSRRTPRLSDLPQAYDEANRSFRHRNLQEINQVLDVEEMTVSAQPIPYPFATEKELVRCIRAGEREEALRTVDRFVEELSASGETELVVRQGIHQLLGVVLHHIILSGFNPQSLYRGADLYEEAGELREPDEMTFWFREKLSVYLDAQVETMRKTQDSLMTETVDQVIALLQEEYAKDISLETYCDRLGISIYKLSAGFKEVTGVNFIDYLTKIRLDKSKELLLRSNEKVNDIAFQVGYQPSYYYRVFKKHEGVTPSQYRDMYKENG